MEKMNFSDWHAPPEGFPSTWKQKREHTSSTTQTDEILSEDKEVQSTGAKHVEVQTEEEEERPFSPEEFEKFPPSLFAFFSRVTDSVCQYLEQNCDPFGAEVFQDIGENDSVADRIETKKEYTLRSDKVSNEFIGSCLAWSKAGSQIAIGYAYPCHDGWCTHKAPVSSWNILRTQNFQENVPTAEVFLPGCVCSMEYHPLDSSIIATGLYTGEVALVDLFSIEKGSVSGFNVKNEDKFDDWTNTHDPTTFVADFGYASYSSGHTLPVVAVKWIRLTQSQYAEILYSGRGKPNASGDATLSGHCCLLSASKDGYISLWSTNNSNNRLKLVKRFIVWADNLPDEVKIGNRNVNGMKEVGVTGLSCCKDDPFAFVFSTFGSYLFQGNLLSEVEAYEAESILQDSLAINKDTLFSPAPVLLGQQEGYTVALDCSPFHRNVFLCATSDGRVYLKNLLQVTTSLRELVGQSYEDMQKVEDGNGGITDVHWSGRPMMLGVSCGNMLKIFDLLVGDSPVATIGHESRITKIAFNRTIIGSIAVTGESGQIEIWKLPSRLTSQDPHEIELFLEATKIHAE